MKLVLDMNLPPAWAKLLTDAGFDAFHWSHVGAPTAPDEEIMRWAKPSQRRSCLRCLGDGGHSPNAHPHTAYRPLTEAAWFADTSRAQGGSLQHSIRLNDQWRVCFRFEGGDAFDVEIVDCH